MGWDGSFCWPTDLHVGRANTYLDDDITPYIRPIANTAVSFTIDTGDCTEAGTIAQFLAYNNTVKPILEALGVLWRVPGNHDNDNWAINYDNWDAHFGDRKFVFDWGRFRFIGFQSDTQGVPADQLTWIGQQLATLNGQIPLFFTHTPLVEITPDYAGWTIINGYTELMNYIVAYNVPAYFAGHKHYPFQYAVQNGCTFINGACRSWMYNSHPTGYMLVDVFSNPNKMVINHYSTPTTLYDSLVLNI